MKGLLFITVFLGIFTSGQLKLDPENSTIKITGTSSLHDWDMNVNEFEAKGVITETHVQNLEVTVRAQSMKSGKTMMDDNAYDAVNADDYPLIRFSSDMLEISENSIKGLGTLEVASRSNNLEFIAEIISDDANEMHLKGSLPLKMSDYGIDPPTSMFGILKTGDDIVIRYDIFISK